MALNVFVGLGVIAAGVVAFIAWVPLARRHVHKAQRVHEVGPETMELRAEPPAIVNYLTNELEVTEDAVAATILDLAARHHVEIIELSLDESLIVPKRHERDQLSAYDDQLLRVIEQAANGGPHATIPAIAAALGHGTARAWLTFAAEVHRDARRRGLTTTPVNGGATKALMLIALLPNIGIEIIQPFAYAVIPFLYVFELLLGIVLLVIHRSSVLSAAGREAATAWLGTKRFIEHYGSFDDLPPGAVDLWDRYLAYGAAMGLSNAAVDGLVHGLRTTISAGDVGSAARAIFKAVRAQHDPVQQRAWRAEQLHALFGVDADPDQIYGPDGGSFWELLDVTARTIGIASMTYKVDRTVWQHATLARLDALVATAPPEMAGDVGVVAQAARHAVEVLSRATVPEASVFTNDAAIAGPDVRSALDRIVAGVGAHLGVEPTADAVVQSLVGTQLHLSQLWH